MDEVLPLAAYGQFLKESLKVYISLPRVEVREIKMRSISVLLI